MPKHELIPTKTFLKDLRKVDPRFRRGVEKGLLKLEENPYQGRKLEAVEIGKWRIRVGDYRIRYDIKSHSVVLLRCRHRKEIYER